MYVIRLLMQAALYCGQHSVGKGAVVCVGGGPPCIGDVCSKEATYGYKGEPAIYCKTCIPEDVKDKVIDVRSKRCEHEGCDTRPSFGKPGDTVSAALFTAVFPKQ
jgi:EsV-1-7 cysteine-rich motif